MKVKELIKELEQMPEDADVYHIETIDGRSQDYYLMVSDLYQKDNYVFIF